MKWKTAGRPRLKPKDEEQDCPWTKQELATYSEPVLAIALAVVNQWKKDGSPEKDAIGIIPWLKIIEEYRSSK